MIEPFTTRGWFLARSKAFAVMAQGFECPLWRSFYAARAELAAWHAARSA